MKIILAMVLAVVMVAGMAPVALADGFADTDSHWAESSIDRWASSGIVEGIGNNEFNPEGSMTRAQAAAMFVRLLKLSDKADISGYNDMDPDAWYADHIAMCVAAGIMEGVGDGLMNPRGTITREQMMVMLCRAVGIAPAETSDKSFADSNKVSDWAEGYVNALVNADIVEGIGSNTMAPQSDINRASMMALLDKGIAVYASTEGETVKAAEGDTGIVLVAAPNVTVTGEASGIAIVEGAAGGTTTITDASVGTVTMTAANSGVVLEGETTAEKVEVAESASGSTVKVEASAAAGEINSDAPETSVKVEGTVEEIKVSTTASNTTIETGSNATIGKVDTAGDGTTVSGKGTVENVATSGNNTNVQTSGTKVEAAEGTTGTTAGGVAVEGGSSASTPSAPVHYHSYTYASNEDGTHTAACSCSATVSEDCDGDTCSKCGYIDGAEAKIGTTYYATFAEAVEVGGEITLIANVTVEESVEIDEGKTVVLDLNGKKINGDWNGESVTNHIYAFHNYGTFTVNDSSNPSVGAIISRGIYNYGTMVLNSGTIDACDANGGYAINGQSGSSFTMNGGSVITSYEDGDEPKAGNYDATTIKIPSGATATINGGTVTNISNYTFAISNEGTTNITGGTFTSIHSTISNYGTMTISGGTFTCNGLEGITAHVIVAWDGSTTNVTGGTFNGKDNYNGFNIDADEGAVVNVSGGIFQSVHSGSLYGKGTINVTGGTFFDKPAAERIASGYKAVESNGNWIVVALTEAEAEAKVGTTNYATFEEAIANAEAGATITLLKDITLTEGWTPIGATPETAFSGTFDGNGKTITGLSNDGYGTNPFGLIAYGIGNVTVKNLTLADVAIASGGEYTAAVMGRYLVAENTTAATYNVRFENITVSGSINASDKAAAILGCNYKSGSADRNKTITITFENCVNNASISGAGRNGGIAGAVSGEFPADGHNNAIKVVFNRCVNNGTVASGSATYKTGAIVGFCGGGGNYEFNACENDGTADGDLIGRHHMSSHTWSPTMSNSNSFEYLDFVPQTLTSYDIGLNHYTVCVSFFWDLENYPSRNHYDTGSYYVGTNLGDDEWRITIDGKHYRIPLNVPVDGIEDAGVVEDTAHLKGNPADVENHWIGEGYELESKNTYSNGSVEYVFTKYTPGK